MLSTFLCVCWPFIYLLWRNVYVNSFPIFKIGLYFVFVFAAAAKLLQSCLTLCDPIDGSPPGSAFPGILQARTLEWVAISLSNVWKWKVKVKSLSPVQLSATPWTAAHQAPLSMGFSRQEYWSGVHCLLLRVQQVEFFSPHSTHYFSCGRQAQGSSILKTF